MFYIVGLDPSLASTGITVIDISGRVIYQEIVGYSLKRTSTYQERMDRLKVIAERVMSVVNAHKVEGRLPYVGIENFAFGAKTSAYDLGGVQAGIKLFMWVRWNLVCLEISNTTARKKVIGNGRASKEEIEAFVKKQGLVIHDHNCRDAWVIAEHYRQLILKTKA